MGRNIQVTRTITVAAVGVWLGVVPLRGDEGRLFPKGQKLTSVVAIDMRELKPAERVMISTLQGNLAKSSARQIFMEEPVLWKGIMDEAALAKQVNASLRDPRRAEGYTAVLVHCWSMDLNNVQNAIQRFAPDVRVVTPEEFMALIRKNVSAKNTNDPRL